MISGAGKATVAALCRSDQPDQGVVQGNRVAALTQEGVICGVNQQGRDPDGTQPGEAAGAFPIILGVSEAVKRSRIAVVKVVKIPYFFVPLQVDQGGEIPLFDFKFFSEFGKKAPHVNSALRPCQGLGAALQIAGHRKGDGSNNCIRETQIFPPEVEEADVATHTKANEDNAGVALCNSTCHDGMQIFGVSVAVESGQAIDLTPAPTEVPGQNIPAFGNSHARHANYVSPL